MKRYFILCLMFLSLSVSINAFKIETIDSNAELRVVSETNPIYVTVGGSGLTIDSGSITIDTEGLAGYNQVQEILDYVYYDSQTFIYGNNADNSDSIITSIITTKVKKLYTDVPTATFDYYGLTDGVIDARKNQIKSITY